MAEIDYVHLPELGIKSKTRSSVDDERVLFADYEDGLSLPLQQKALSALSKLEGRVVLTCFEKSYRDCHRQFVYERLNGGGGHL